MTETRASLVTIKFEWSKGHGDCQECGLPAAFFVKNAYGVGKHMRVDAICAANYAADGNEIARIEPEGA